MTPAGSPEKRNPRGEGRQKIAARKRPQNWGRVYKNSKGGGPKNGRIFFGRNSPGRIFRVRPAGFGTCERRGSGITCCMHTRPRGSSGCGSTWMRRVCVCISRAHWPGCWGAVEDSSRTTSGCACRDPRAAAGVSEPRGLALRRRIRPGRTTAAAAGGKELHDANASRISAASRSWTSGAARPQKGRVNTDVMCHLADCIRASLPPAAADRYIILTVDVQ